MKKMHGISLKKFRDKDGKVVNGLWTSDVVRFERVGEQWQCQVPLREIGKSNYFEFRPVAMGGHFMTIGMYGKRSGGCIASEYLQAGNHVLRGGMMIEGEMTPRTLVPWDATVTAAIAATQGTPPQTSTTTSEESMSTKPAPTEPAATPPAATPDAVAQPVATTVAQPMPIAGQAADTRPDLHDDIMRLPCAVPFPIVNDSNLAYKEGHRDARHAAAELAAASAAMPRNLAEERAEFEATQRERESDLSLDADGNYANPYVDSAWEGWQDRAVRTASPVPTEKAAVSKRPLPPRDQSLPNSGLEPDWNGYELATKDAAQGDAKHLVDAVTAVMSKHGLIDHLPLGATERFCDELLASFTANAEQGVALPSTLPPASQGYAWRGMNPDLRDAINNLTRHDAEASASFHAGIGQGLSEADTLAHMVLNLAASKRLSSKQLHTLMAMSPPDGYTPKP